VAIKIEILELVNAERARLEDAEDAVLRVKVEISPDHDGLRSKRRRDNRVAAAVDRGNTNARGGKFCATSRFLSSLICCCGSSLASEELELDELVPSTSSSDDDSERDESVETEDDEEEDEEDEEDLRDDAVGSACRVL